MRILVINPGSTSTKLAVYDDDRQILLKNVKHSADELSRFPEITDQFPFRLRIVEEEVKAAGIEYQFDAVIGRGGLSKAVESGVYEVNPKMLADARNATHKHACDLGCIIAYHIAHDKTQKHCHSFIADPGVVDELCDEARISGSPEMRRICIWHALNQKAIARKFAKEQGRKYEDMNLIVCHLGGGISVAAHEKGRAVDANNALDGEGPFSPVRAGSLPIADVVRMCFSGRFTESELIAYISGKAGLTAHLGTNDMPAIIQRIGDGDKKAALVVDAMIYHIAKNICAEGAVLCGKVDAILLTGGLAYCDYLVERLKKRIEYLAPVYCYPGENEMEALAMNALEVLNGSREAKEY